jgi:hypothetical protein
VSGVMENDDGHSGRSEINPEGLNDSSLVEEDGEAHLHQMLATDPGFRRAWEAGRAKRELELLILEKRVELGLSHPEDAYW